MADPAEALGLGTEPPHEYGAGPPGRWTRAWSDRTVTGLTAVGALVVGFLLVAGLAAGRTAATVEDERKDELIALIDARQNHIESLAARLDDLREQVADAEAASAAGVPVLQAALNRTEAAAGLTALTGPGLRVTLSDADGECPESPQNCHIQDADLQETLNTLFGVGAEAVAINSERVIATTAVRSAGRVITVNYRVLTSPYVIEAIGDPEIMEEEFLASDLSEAFGAWTEAYGLGFAVEQAGDLMLPAYDGSVGLREARPVEDPVPSQDAG